MSTGGDRTRATDASRPGVGGAPRGVEAVAVEAGEAGGGGYQVLVGPGLVPEGAAELLAERAPAHRYAVISDDRVGPLHARPLAEALTAAGLAAEVYAFAAGEAHKTRATWAEVTDWMLARGFGRDTVVVAVGGGVVGDLAGFVAATFLRGVPAVQVPTSLLAMIDASVGGKTGVDTPAGKNLVGAFHPPRVVLADPRVIATLPVAERAQGLVEAVKHGAIRDRAYLDDVSAAVPGVLGRAATEGRGTAGPEGAPPPPDLDAVQRVVAGSVRIKAEVVSADEREGGLRKILNFGHTLGHALEAASGYGIGHGAAVALGMVLEARLGEALGVTRPGTAADLAKTLGALDIPLTLPPGVDLAAVEGYLGRDKKARSGRPEFVLLEDLGRVAYDEDWARPVPPEAVREVLTTAAEAAPQGGS